MLSKKDIEILNSKKGIYELLKSDEIDLRKTLDKLKFDKAMKEKHLELVKLQKWVIENEQKILVIIEGRDAAGKGGAIKTLTKNINPRHYRAVALGKPSIEEKNQWFFQRYIKLLPKPSEIVFFDRSWYNRAIVEPVNGFCSKEEYDLFMEQVNDLEYMLTRSGIKIIKIYLKISKEEQARRFNIIRSRELMSWKLTDVDKNAQNLWEDYSKYEKIMLSKTSPDNAKWKEIDANNSYTAYLSAASHILNSVDYC